MLRTLFTLLFVSSIFVSAKADAYSDGFITAVIIDSFSSDCDCEPKELSQPRYNLVTIDTALFDFPKNESPQCYDIQVKVKTSPLTFGQRIIATLLLFVMIMTCIYIISQCSDEEQDRFIGILVGHVVSRNMGRRRRC